MRAGGCARRRGRPIPVSMLDFELTELDRQGDWRIVLNAYHTASTAARESAPQFNGWLGRMPDLDGFEPDQLSRIHGRLIATGYLKFQLADRDAGLQYQLSPEGRRALNGTGEISAEENETADE